MTDEWDRLASTKRWRSLVTFIREWVGPFDSRHGMSNAQLQLVLSQHSFASPSTVREWYQLSANWDSHGQNVWIPAQALSVVDDTLPLLTDRDGTSTWGIMAQDLQATDPPVVTLEPFGDFMADGPLESASVVAFAYPSNGPILCRSRSDAGNALVRKLQKTPRTL
jgi:hypothetical protein